jgi:hypothetical protein
MNKIIVSFEFPGMTSEHYDKVMDELNKTGSLTNNGMIEHQCGVNSKGVFVFDVWESEEAFRKFSTVLMPIFAKLGIPKSVPNVIPLHNSIVQHSYSS